MPNLMRCPFCGLLQDEPGGAKACLRCGGGLEYENKLPTGQVSSYLQVQMELDQVAAPAGRNVERYLLVTIHTPDQVPSHEAAPAGKVRPPLGFSAVLDVSGSMHGEKLPFAKEAVRQAVRLLRSGDTFSLATFSMEAKCPFPPEDVDENTLARLEEVLQTIEPGGNTALDAGLELGIANAAKKKRDTNLVMLLSDGQANMGETDLEKIGTRAFNARKKDMLVSTLGVGSDYNEALMAEVATQGGGRFYHVEQAGRILVFMAGELGEAAAMAARDVQISLNIPQGATLVPLSSAYPVTQQGDKALVFAGDIPCATELEIPLRLALLGQKAGTRLSLDGNLSFNSPAGNQISLPINGVSVRFMEAKSWQLREGVVMPVAEKVFSQMKASSVVGVTRMRTMRPGETEKEEDRVLSNLRAYSELLGEERFTTEVNEMRSNFVAYAASPMLSKQALFNANKKIRSSKDFDKK